MFMKSLARLFYLSLSFFLAITCAIAQTKDTVDLTNFYNKPLSIDQGRLTQVLIDGIKAGEIQAYNSLHSGFDKITVETFLNRMELPPMDWEFEDFGFINDDEWSCWCDEDEFVGDELVVKEYFFATDLYHYIIDRSENGSINALTLALPDSHPLNTLGAEVPIVKLKWSEVKPLLKYQFDLNYYHIHDNSAPIPIDEALELEYYAKGNPQLPTDRYQIVLDKKIGNEQNIEFKLGYNEGYDVLAMNIPGFTRKDGGVIALMLDLINTEQIDIYKTSYGSQSDRMSYSEFKERFVLYEYEYFIDDNFDEGFEDWSFEEEPDEHIIRPTSNDLTFRIRGEIILKNGEFVKTPKWIDLTIPYYHPDNMRGISVPITAIKYSDFIDLTIQNDTVYWVDPFDANNKLSIAEAFNQNKFIVQYMLCSDVYGQDLFDLQRQSTYSFFDHMNEVLVTDTTSQLPLNGNSSYKKLNGAYKGKVLKSLKPYLLKSVVKNDDRKIARNFTVTYNWTDSQSESLDLIEFKRKAVEYFNDQGRLEEIKLTKESIDSLLSVSSNVTIKEGHELQFVGGKLVDDKQMFSVIFTYQNEFVELSLSPKDLKKIKDKTIYKRWKKNEMVFENEEITDHNGYNFYSSYRSSLGNKSFVDFWFKPATDYLGK